MESNITNLTAAFYEYERLTDELLLDENEKLKVYFDSLGIATIGIGRNLATNGITQFESRFLFGNDVNTCVTALDLHFPWWRTLPPNAARVMINLTFNMGIFRLAGFARFLEAMKRNDYAAAQVELRASKWFGQVGQRGPRMCARLQGYQV